MTTDQTRWHEEFEIFVLIKVEKYFNFDKNCKRKKEREKEFYIEIKNKIKFTSSLPMLSCSDYYMLSLCLCVGAFSSLIFIYTSSFYFLPKALWNY